MVETLRPAEESEVTQAFREAASRGQSYDIVGSGSKQRIGRPPRATAALSTRNFRGVTLYEPTEFVISARAGTLLSVVEAELAKHNQQLAFEPADVGPMLGGPAGQATIGGIIAANLSGSRRLSAGAARDHLLGIRAINGRGEAIKSGGRVMKNVTGYDVSKVLAGSWGTLALLTEVTLKAVPRPEDSATLLLVGQPDEIAVEAMCAAMGTPFEVTSAIHIDANFTKRMLSPAARSIGRALTALRLENFTSSVAYRLEQLQAMFQPYGEILTLDQTASRGFWSEVRQLSFMQASTDPVWRISTAPRMGPHLVQAISGFTDLKVAYDWSGGLIWLEVPASADASAADIHRLVAIRGGEALLFRADAAIRANVDVFQPLEKPHIALTQRIKDAFDPANVLNPGRMYAFC